MGCATRGRRRRRSASESDRPVDAVQHGVDGLGQLPQLLLRARHRDAGVQMSGVDLVQLVGQDGELLRRHAGGGVQLGRRGGQLLDGSEGFFDGARVLEEVGQQRDQLADHQDTKAKHPQGDRVLQVQGDGVGLGAVGELEGIAGGPAGVDGQQGEEVDLPGVEIPLPAAGGRRPRQPVGQPDASGLSLPGGDGVVPGGHPQRGLGRGHAPFLHQGGDVSALALGPDHHPAGKQEGQQQVGGEVDAQQAQEESEMSRATMEDRSRPGGLWACFVVDMGTPPGKNGGIQPWRDSQSSTGSRYASSTQSPPWRKASWTARS